MLMFSVAGFPSFCINAQFKVSHQKRVRKRQISNTNFKQICLLEVVLGLMQKKGCQNVSDIMNITPT